MNPLVAIKTQNDEFQVEYEILSHIDISAIEDTDKRDILIALQDVEKHLTLCEDEIAKLSTDINNLTNHSDGIDYAVAVISGIISGLIDSFCVGEIEIDKEKIQEFLERKYHTANDSGYKHKNSDGNWTSSAMYHRLDDLAHHPTIGGLIASILVRYFRLVTFIDGSDGKPHIFFADTSSPEATKQEIQDLMKAWIGATIGGVCIWLSNATIKKYEEVNDEEMPEPLKKIIKVVGASPLILEVLKTVDVWVGHMMSDVSTSQGIPGIFLSLLKEISVLPVIRDTDFRVWVDGLYNKGNMNLSEWGGVVFTAAKKQSLPILINEAIVRIFYFVRSLTEELKAKKDFKLVDWNKIIPFKNRTVERMMTIASGTLAAVDIADAAIRSGGFNAACLLRVNYVGIGRFAIAIGVDAGMGIKRSQLVNERIKVMGKELELLNAKVYYRCAQLHYAEADMLEAEEHMWISAQNAERTINMAYEMAQDSVEIMAESLTEIRDSMGRISSYRSSIEEKNPGLIKEIVDTLKY